MVQGRRDRNGAHQVGGDQDFPPEQQLPPNACRRTGKPLPATLDRCAATATSTNDQITPATRIAAPNASKPWATGSISR